LSEADFTALPTDDFSAWFAPNGELVAIGRASQKGGFAVERGFVYVTSTSST
jgi:hypothetical protein